MNVGKRAFLYLTRKKGKNLLLGIVFLLISFSLLTGSVVYLGIRQVSEDLRSNIGASFNIRPYEQFDMNNGQVSSKGTPVIIYTLLYCYFHRWKRSEMLQYRTLRLCKGRKPVISRRDRTQ